MASVYVWLVCSVLGDAKTNSFIDVERLKLVLDPKHNLVSL